MKERNYLFWCKYRNGGDILIYFLYISYNISYNFKRNNDNNNKEKNNEKKG